MIILLQSMTVHFRRLFWHISYYKVRQSNLLQSVKDCYYKVCQVLPKCDRLLLQSVSSITKCDRLFYQVRQFLQSETYMKYITIDWCADMFDDVFAG